MPDPVEVRAKLEEVFEDTLRKKVSVAGIFVSYNDEGQARIIVGFPYEVSEDDHLVIGPYLKTFTEGIPKDYHSRKKRVPLRDIGRFKRIDTINLSDVFNFD